MEHQGRKLRSMAAAKGFNIKQLSERLDITRVAVERNFKAESISRKVLMKYASLLDFDIDEFYEGTNEGSAIITNEQNDSIVIELYKKLLKEKDERIKLLESQVRFFPNAAQLV
ncbi:helix-turn-helix domain-containing protein [Spirosoma aerolatum]|uniref:helix-turn-helix domain-containing protein n=1 Tax=Spirosoma aerolatum TaxID=1211326 RepID=UPI0009ACF1D8|nr:helix-turn-helix transcriptional regulator [Spirosoma aerolatum]